MAALGITLIVVAAFAAFVLRDEDSVTTRFMVWLLGGAALAGAALAVIG